SSDVCSSDLSTAPRSAAARTAVPLPGNSRWMSSYSAAPPRRFAAIAGSTAMASAPDARTIALRFTPRTLQDVEYGRSGVGDRRLFGVEAVQGAHPRSADAELPGRGEPAESAQGTVQRARAHHGGVLVVGGQFGQQHDAGGEPATRAGTFGQAC